MVPFWYLLALVWRLLHPLHQPLRTSPHSGPCWAARTVSLISKISYSSGHTTMSTQASDAIPSSKRWVEKKRTGNHGLLPLTGHYVTLCGQEAAVKVLIVNPCFSKRCCSWQKKNTLFVRTMTSYRELRLNQQGTWYTFWCFDWGPIHFYLTWNISNSFYTTLNHNKYDNMKVISTANRPPKRQNQNNVSVTGWVL